MIMFVMFCLAGTSFPHKRNEATIMASPRINAANDSIFLVFINLGDYLHLFPHEGQNLTEAGIGLPHLLHMSLLVLI